MTTDLPEVSKELVAFRETFGPCEVCGGWAMSVVWDLDEMTEPGGDYKTFRPRGKFHAFCTEHERGSIVYPALWREDLTPYEMKTPEFALQEDDD